MIPSLPSYRKNKPPLFYYMRKAVTDLMRHIYTLPFNQELAQGTLSKERFSFYLTQDILYLTDFSKALALTAVRLPYPAQSKLFMQFAMDTLKTEREFHLDYLKKYTDLDVEQTQQSPFCFMYTNYLLRMASLAPVEEAVASLIPCFWVYQQVGKKAFTKRIPNHPYQAWINLYTHPEFSLSVNLVLSLVNTLGKAASDSTQKNMITAFKQATQLEYQFWQGAYDQESWLTKPYSLYNKKDEKVMS